MNEDRIVTVYSDYKSPYAYLAKGPAYELAREYRVRLDWRPYILDIPSYLGSARVDDQGQVIEEARNAHQWRRVRYSYMDCRRQARKQGLVIRGTRKIWGSRLAAAGMLHALRQGGEVFRRYHDTVFDRFWRRDLDIENLDTIAEVLSDAGGDHLAFRAGCAALLDEVSSIAREAETLGVFGVPTFVLNGEIFWGREHLPDIAGMLERR